MIERWKNNNCELVAALVGDEISMALDRGRMGW